MWRESWRELLLGAGVAVIAYLAVRGADLTPFLLLCGVLGAVYFLSQGRSATGFEAVRVGGSPPCPVTFADIGGQEVAKRELLEALDFMKDAAAIGELGIRPLKGILLTGPPGTGKTMLAKAAANYTSSAFIAASGSEFIEMYAGVGAQRVRQLFNRARALAKKEGRRSAIVFIDEIEVLGGKRGQHTSHLEYDQTLNQLLVEMDGLRSDDEVNLLLIGATNRADLLDPALLRPGRFDRQVQVDLPDKEGRLNILRIHTQKKPLGADVNLEELARETFGFSGAHLESLANEAAILAYRRGRTEIAMSDLKEAVDKVMLGEKLERKPTREELVRVAVHESGHALTSELLHPNSVAAVTVASRGKALGFVRQAPEKERYLYTGDYLRDQIAIALGGALAEELVYANRSTGAANDFQQAAYLAKQVVTSGLSALGIVTEETVGQDRLRQAVEEIIRAEEQRVKDLLADRRDLIEKLAQSLAEAERLAGEEFRRLLAA
ncbi:MAG: AAA family ATPase [Patescibacteria group bacterium]